MHTAIFRRFEYAKWYELSQLAVFNVTNTMFIFVTNIKYYINKYIFAKYAKWVNVYLILKLFNFHVLNAQLNIIFGETYFQINQTWFKQILTKFTGSSQNTLF